MVELLLLLLGGCGLSAGVLALRLGEARRWRADLIAYELRFPRDLKVASVTDFIRGISGIVASRTQRPFTVRAVVLNVTGSFGRYPAPSSRPSVAHWDRSSVASRVAAASRS